MSSRMSGRSVRHRTPPYQENETIKSSKAVFNNSRLLEEYRSERPFSFMFGHSNGGVLRRQEVHPLYFLRLLSHPPRYNAIFIGDIHINTTYDARRISYVYVRIEHKVHTHSSTNWRPARTLWWLISFSSPMGYTSIIVERLHGLFWARHAGHLICLVGYPPRPGRLLKVLKVA